LKQVLLLDDNPTQVSIRDLVLRKAGLECEIATSPQSALALLRSTPGRNSIGLVVTDHVMPGMDGMEFVRQLREFNPAVPVIVISGLAEAEQEYEGLNVIFRIKPCDPEALIELVRTVLNPRYRASA
jgi:DNA-binding response OmpR family regulator